MFYFKNSLDKAKQKAGQLGIMAKNFASEIIVTENLQNDSIQKPNARPVQLKEMPMILQPNKADLIEDLNSSPQDVSQNNNPLEIPKMKEKKTHSTENLSEKKQANDNFLQERALLQEKIKELEAKIKEMEVQIASSNETKEKDNEKLLQKQLEPIDSNALQIKINELFTKNFDEFAKVLSNHLLTHLDAQFVSYLESENIDSELINICLETFHNKEPLEILEKTTLFNSNLALDLEKIKTFFLHDAEYEIYKAKNLEFERLINDFSQEIKAKNSENDKIKQENISLIAQNTATTTSLQEFINTNVELERQNQDLQAIVEKNKEELISFEEKIKHYEGILLSKNEDLAKFMEKAEGLERICNDFQKKLDDLQEENAELKEKEFRNQILHDQNEEIMRNFRNSILKYSKELCKSFENIDITAEIKKLENESLIDFNTFLQEIERFLNMLNGSISDHYRKNVENIRKSEREKNETLVKNISKIQSDYRELSKIDKENKQKIEEIKRNMEKTIEERDNLQSSVVLKDSKVKEQQKLLADLQENKRSFVEELKIKSKEIDQNKQRIKIIEEEKEALMRFNEKLLEENRIIDAYRHEVEEKTNEIKALQSTLEENQQEISSLNTGLHNLQTVHEETQLRNELLAKKYDNELKRLRNELEISNKKCANLNDLQNNFDELEKKQSENLMKIKELERKYRESEQEKADIKSETNALIKKVKNETLYKENLVDKRVVCKFLVNYFEPTTTYHVKLQILETLSSILSFTNEERAKIGLHKNFLEKQLVKQNSSEKMPENFKNKSVEEGETLKDKLMIFLMNEDDEN